MGGNFVALEVVGFDVVHSIFELLALATFTSWGGVQ